MDFSRMLQTWLNVTTHPNEMTFESELQQPQAKLANAIIWIIIAAVILAILSAIGALIASLLGVGSSMMQMILSQANLPPEVQAQLLASGAAGGGGFLTTLCTTLIGAPIGFIIGSAIYFLVAKLFSGTGTFEQHTYALATFTAPLMVVTGVLGIIPVLGGCVSLLVWIYQIYLTYLAMKVTHRLSSSSALVVAIAPAVIAFFCVCVGLIAFGSIIAAAVGGSNLSQ